MKFYNFIANYPNFFIFLNSIKNLLLLIFALVIVGCNGNNKIKMKYKKPDIQTGNNRKKVLFKDKKLEETFNDFAKQNPIRMDSVETYYISFGYNKNDTIIFFYKDLYNDDLAFINQEIEYKGWVVYKDNYINIVDKKINPIGSKFLNYSLLSKKYINDKKVVEYHGQKKFNQLSVKKIYMLKNGILKEKNDFKLLDYFQ